MNGYGRKREVKGSEFTPSEMNYFRKLKAIKRVTPKRLYYTEEFQRHCIKQYKAGESPSRIFRRAGLPPQLIGYKRIERAFHRWLKPEREDNTPGAQPSSDKVSTPKNEHALTSANDTGEGLEEPEVITNPQFIETLDSINSRLEEITIIMAGLHQTITEQYQSQPNAAQPDDKEA